MMGRLCKNFQNYFFLLIFCSCFVLVVTRPLLIKSSGWLPSPNSRHRSTNLPTLLFKDDKSGIKSDKIYSILKQNKSPSKNNLKPFNLSSNFDLKNKSALLPTFIKNSTTVKSSDKSNNKSKVSQIDNLDWKASSKIKLTNATLLFKNDKSGHKSDYPILKQNKSPSKNNLKPNNLSPSNDSKNKSALLPQLIKNSTVKSLEKFNIKFKVSQIENVDLKASSKIKLTNATHSKNSSLAGKSKAIQNSVSTLVTNSTRVQNLIQRTANSSNLATQTSPEKLKSTHNKTSTVKNKHTISNVKNMAGQKLTNELGSLLFNPNEISNLSVPFYSNYDREPLNYLQFRPLPEADNMQSLTWDIDHEWIDQIFPPTQASPNGEMNDVSSSMNKQTFQAAPPSMLLQYGSNNPQTSSQMEMMTQQQLQPLRQIPQQIVTDPFSALRTVLTPSNVMATLKNVVGKGTEFVQDNTGPLILLFMGALSMDMMLRNSEKQKKMDGDLKNHREKRGTTTTTEAPSIEEISTKRPRPVRQQQAPVAQFQTFNPLDSIAFTPNYYSLRDHMVNYLYSYINRRRLTGDTQLGLDGLLGAGGGLFSPVLQLSPHIQLNPHIPFSPQVHFNPSVNASPTFDARPSFQFSPSNTNNPSLSLTVGPPVPAVPAPRPSNRTKVARRGDTRRRSSRIPPYYLNTRSHRHSANKDNSKRAMFMVEPMEQFSPNFVRRRKSKHRMMGS